MSYKHVQQEVIANAQQYDANGLLTGSHGGADTFVSNPAQHSVDGIAVVSQLAEFVAGIRKAFPALKFYPGEMWATYTGDNGVVFRSYRELYAGVPGQLYLVGRIGYCGYQQTSDEDFYMVDSRLIANEKYSTRNERYSMRLTTNINRAIKNALVNLVPYSTLELTHRCYREFRAKSYEVGENKGNTLERLLGQINKVALLNEIRSLKSAGVQFSTQEFRAVAAECDEAVQVSNAEKGKRVDALLVHFLGQGQNMFAESVPVQDIRRTAYPVGNDAVTTHTLADIPELIREKVAVLQTLLPGNHVDGVGMKMSDRLFWVEK
jgi:hypothetical protein